MLFLEFFFKNLILKKNKIKKIQSDELIWPLNLSKKIYNGFSSNELQYISDENLIDKNKNLPKKNASTMYWPVELYSFGRCYREWLNLPYWFPLPLYGDHGINPSGVLSDHEKNSKPKSFLTWNTYRAKELKRNSKKEILQITHPWIIFRRSNRIKKKKDSRGTLIFLFHFNPGYQFPKFNYKEYFDELKRLPKRYHPLVICVHNHDIKNKRYLEITKYGLPIISAGETSSPYFVERYYNIISRFSYGTSVYGGSELYYCEELGLKFFIKGENFFSKTKNDRKLFQKLIGCMSSDKTYKDVTQEHLELFSEFPPKKSIFKKIFINKILSLNINVERSRKKLLKYLYIELIRHIHLLPFNILKTFIKRNRNLIFIKILLLLRKKLISYCH
jgi:hypothetical protein